MLRRSVAASHAGTLSALLLLAGRPSLPRSLTLAVSGRAAAQECRGPGLGPAL